MLAAAGAADFVSAVLRSTILLQVTPDAMRGRLSGIELAQVAGTPALGNLEAGIVASLVSVRFAIVSAACCASRARRSARRCCPPSATLREAGVIGREFFARSVHEVAPDLIGVDAPGRRRGRPDRRGRGVPPRGPGRARLRRSDGAERLDVRAAGPRVRLPVVRDPLVRERRLRGGRLGVGRPDPRARADGGIDVMRERRGLDDLRALCSGPGKLCQALGITREHDGRPLDRPPFELRERVDTPEVARGPRIGISKAVELPWRYALTGSPYLSRALRPR